MTVYERIIKYSANEMAKFLLAFSEDTIRQLERFEFPTEEKIMEFLKLEIPE